MVDVWLLKCELEMTGTAGEWELEGGGVCVVIRRLMRRRWRLYSRYAHTYFFNCACGWLLLEGGHGGFMLRDLQCMHGMPSI